MTDLRATGGTDYATYLLIDDLLDLQRPITPEAHDELLFIVVHQAYELWFKLILHELVLARAELTAGRPQTALAPLRRVNRIWEVLLKQLDVLETMTPEGFLEFRDPLAPASGFQSRQFREIEADAEPLFSAFLDAGRALGLALPADDDAARVEGLADLHRDHAEPARACLHMVAEALMDHDESVARWRFHHVLMAAREIGTRPGTGGSRGVQYLQTTLERRFFGDLWAVRAAL
jgi:tryptophan 2,3-dioxygenase